MCANASPKRRCCEGKHRACDPEARVAPPFLAHPKYGTSFHRELLSVVRTNKNCSVPGSLRMEDSECSKRKTFEFVFSSLSHVPCGGAHCLSEATHRRSENPSRFDMITNFKLFSRRSQYDELWDTQFPWNEMFDYWSFMIPEDCEETLLRVRTARNFFGVGDEVCLHSLLARFVYLWLGIVDSTIVPSDNASKYDFLFQLHGAGKAPPKHSHVSPWCLT